METIDYMNGRISFANEIKSLLETARKFASPEDEERYTILINHCENVVTTEEHYIGIILEMMESEEMLNVR